MLRFARGAQNQLASLPRPPADPMKRLVGWKFTYYTTFPGFDQEPMSKLVLRDPFSRDRGRVQFLTVASSSCCPHKRVS